MQFTEIRLTNFGQYNGEHRIDLRSPAAAGDTNDRPVFLIGGKNGAGKTTILDAVKLCLHGAAALGPGVKRPEYETYLLGRIHRQIGAPLSNIFAGVGVSFVHSVGGANLAFDVRRMWQRKRRGIEEILEVRRDGAPLAAHEYAWWEQFLHDLLPPSLANLFFFDGEQIQILANDPDNSVLRSSIRALLGLDLLNRLRADLAIYVARQKRTGDTSLEQQLTQLAEERSQIEEDFQTEFIKLGVINREIGQRRGKIEDEERLLASEGGGVAARRDALKQRAELLRSDLHRYERMIAEQAGGLLPFAAVPALSSALRERLAAEEQLEQQRAVRTIADAFAQELIGRLMRDKQWLGGVFVNPQFLPHVIGGLTNTIAEVANELTGASANASDHELLHDLSKNERQELIGWLDQAITTTPLALQELTATIETATQELSQIEKTLQQLPAEETIQPILQRLATLQREFGALEEQHKQQEVLAQQRRLKRDEMTRKEQELYTRLMRGDDPTYRLRLAGRAQLALLKYEAVLQQAKITELE